MASRGGSYAGTMRPLPAHSRGMGAPGDAASRVVQASAYWNYATTVLILLFALVPVRVHELFPFLFRPLRPALTIAIPAALLLIGRSSPDALRAAFRYPQTLLVLAFFAFALITFPFALWPGEALATVRGLLPAVLLVVACMLVRPTRVTLDKVQLAFVAFVLFFATFQQMFARSWAGRLRPLGGSYDSNDVAALLALTFPLAAGILIRARRGRPRTIAALAVVALVLGVVATGSRGGTLALIAGALVFALPMRGSRGTAVWMAMIVGGILAWSQAPQNFRQRMLSLSNLENDYNYTHDTGRKAVWARGRGYWRANPIAGVGAGNFAVAEGDFNAETGRTGKWSAAHNSYVQVLAELGTIGGVLFILMLLTAAKSAFPLWWHRRPRPGRGPPVLNRPEFFASLAATASAGYFLSHTYFSPLYAVLGLIALADRTASAEKGGESAGAVSPVVDGIIRRSGERGGLSLVKVPPAQ